MGVMVGEEVLGKNLLAPAHPVWEVKVQEMGITGN